MDGDWRSENTSSGEVNKDPIFTMGTFQEKSDSNICREQMDNDGDSFSSNEGLCNVIHRKDHEFIPTRMKTINASRPAADPTQFTKIPSNPLLISAQKQLLKAEEVKRQKAESAAQVNFNRRGEDEPVWQSELSSWKNRRRKQSEGALQRVAEVTALGTKQDIGNEGDKKISIGKKLSSLLLSDPNDDWSDLGIEKKSIKSNNSNEKKNDVGRRKSTINSDSSSDPCPKQETEVTNVSVSSGLEVTSQSAIPSVKQLSKQLVEVEGSKIAERSPPARRKSSELSSSMKSRLQPFSVAAASKSTSELKEIMPDQQFREKLQTFRKISEGRSQEVVIDKKPAKLSYSTLIGNGNYGKKPELSPTNSATEDSVDQLLDDALEESYQSVLETSMKDDDDETGLADLESRPLYDDVVAPKAPPTEAPPPLPVDTDASDEIDKQEMEIIASLEMEEKEHRRYMDTLAAERQKQITQSGRIGKTSVNSDGERDIAGVKRSSIESETSRKQLQAVAKDQVKEQQKKNISYNQHWLVQEAEQRRISEARESVSPSRSHSRMGSSPFQENRNAVYENFSVAQVRHNQELDNISGGGDTNNFPSSQTGPLRGNFNANLGGNINNPKVENVYANAKMHSTYSSDESHIVEMQNYSGDGGGIPGPRIPPRSHQHHPKTSSSEGKGIGHSSTDRVLSVSGKKRCSHCKNELGRGAAMIIESLRLFYHLRCFQCCVCHTQLGNGASGTDVRVRNNKLHCQNCYSNDEGLKFSKV